MQILSFDLIPNSASAGAFESLVSINKMLVLTYSKSSSFN